MSHTVPVRIAKRRVTLLLTMLTVCVLAGRCAGQSPVPENQHAKPLQLQLIHSVDGSAVHVGDPVKAKVLAEWAGEGCTLPAASLLSGTVKRVSGGVHPAVSIAFEYHCGQSAPVPLVWLALLSPAAAHHQQEQGPNFQGFSFHNSLFGSAGNTITNHSDMSGRQNPSMPVFADSGEESSDKPPATLKTGEVWKLPHLALEVGAGSENGTVVRSTAGALKVPSGSVLVLQPESVAMLRNPTSVPLSLSAPVAKASVQLPPMLKPCRHPACWMVSNSTSSGDQLKTLRTVSLRSVGYSRLHSAAMQELEHSTTLTYLSPHTILFTFTPHTLVRRGKADRMEDWPHDVRGLVFDVESGALLRSMTWRVPDRRQYLWNLPTGGAVVHEDDSLRWLGEDGQTVRTLPLKAPLLWFESAPDGKHFIVATIHELHSAREHEELVHADAAGPEEQAEMEVLDGDLHVVDRGTASSRLMAPLLEDDARLELRHRARSDDWFLRAVSWRDGSVQELARFRSTCMPRLQAMANGLLMADGCDDVHMGHWYTIFSQDGTPLVRGELGMHDLEPLTAADARSGDFVVSVPQGSDEVLRGALFHGADLLHENVHVFGRDGASLGALEMQYPLPAMQPAAIAPGAGSFAVVDGDAIHVYSLGGGTGEPPHVAAKQVPAEAAQQAQ